MVSESLARLDVSNVYLYVGDAVRFDYLDDRIRERGTLARTISASTHSPPSFASLVTGRYPPRHGVETFSNRIGADVPRLFDVPDIDSRFCNSIFKFAAKEHEGTLDPIYSVLNVGESSASELAEIRSPFVFVERGPGGHAPYGDFDAGASEYFLDRSDADRETIEADYARSIERDAELFEKRVQTLADRRLLEDTLVIYTADHGEMLGENGLLGHNGPMCPELVSVPTVFVHPEIPGGERTESPIHHVDILPTVCALLDCGATFRSEMDGKSLLSPIDDDPRPCFWSNGFLSDSLPLLSGQLEYNGVWDGSGGHVFAATGAPDRLAVLGGKLLRSSKRSYMRRHLRACLRVYLRGDTTYGDPKFSRSEARGILDHVTGERAQSVETDLAEDAQRQLRDLGYLE